jgi:hypothetical protein
LTIEHQELLARLDAAERRIAELEHSAVPSRGAAASSGGVEVRRPSRRDLFKIAGVATAGAAAAAVIGSKPAAAADNSDLVLGVTTNTAEAETALSYDGPAGALIDSNNNALPLLGVDASMSATTGSGSGGLGVQGVGDVGQFGVVGAASGGSGTVGASDNGIGVLGYTSSDFSTSPPNYGADLLAGGNGNLIQAALPAAGLSSPSGPPNFTSLGAGNGLFELVRDEVGGLCSSDTNGVFHRINSVILLPSPVRVIDTRTHKGITGPLSSGRTYTSTPITGSSGIPAGALGVVGTLTMVAGTSGGNLGGAGYLAVFPGGTSYPGTSNVNGDTSYAIATGCTVGLGTGAHAGEVSIYVDSPSPVNAVLDVAAYIL